MRILIIEDERTLNRTLSEGLRELGYQTDEAENIKDAEYFISIRNYDLVLLDWHLPDGLGIDLIDLIKEKSQRTVVVMISPKNDFESEVKAFKLGVDDYLSKPFDFDVLIARIEARLRFGGINKIEIDDLIIEPDEERIFYKGDEIDLKGKPFEVLTHLARHRDQIVSKEQLLDAIWEEPELVTPNVIEVAINQIRQKMDKPLNIDTIETVEEEDIVFVFLKKMENN